MRRVLLLFFILGMVCHVSGHDSLNYTDPSGRKQGRWKKHDKDGHALYDGQFKDGVPSGTFRYYYTDGKLKAIAVMSDDGQTARTVSYANNDRKIAEGNYRNEKKDSTWKYYSDYDGALLSEENYTLGVKNGVFLTFYPNGKMAERINYRDGQKDGEWIQYFNDGNLKFEGSYSHGEQEGPFIGYYPGQKIQFSGAYKAGRKDGAWIFYEENGAVKRSETFSEGALVKDNKQ